MPKTESSDQYSDQEAQQRFHKLVHVALNTRPKPQKSMARKGVAAQSKKKKRRAKTA